MDQRRGGTLRLRVSQALDRLDPVSSHQVPIGQLTRLHARQLFTYRSDQDPTSWQAVAPVPDLAAHIPSIYNAGVGASYTSYVIHLRPGVHWDTTPPRAVTAHDVVRGLKRMCNPLCPPTALPYFTSTIRGMAEFRDGYADALAGRVPVPAELARYQDTTDVAGVFALDDETVVIELLRPALDLINILALPCASPAPAEYDAYLPDSAELSRNLRSNGPYRLVHVSADTLRLARNPVWRPETDPVRGQYPDSIEVLSADPATQRRTEDTDLAIDAPGDGVHRYPGYALDPYLAVNVVSPNAGGALGDAGVRRAIAAAIDRAAVAAIVGRFATGAVRPAVSIIPPGSDGHQDVPPPDGPGIAPPVVEGRPELTMVHIDTPLYAAVARSCAADLDRAGVTVRLLARDRRRYRELLADRRRAAAGDWDIAVASWSPDWFHDNGRVFLQPLCGTSTSGGTANYGHYTNPHVDELIDRALAAPEPTAAVAAWREAERHVLADAAIVPMLFRLPDLPAPANRRLRDVGVLAALGGALDLSGVWLDQSG